MKSEFDKALNKQKEQFDSAFTELEKRITKLGNDNDNLEQCGGRVYLRIEDVPVANEETTEEVFKKIKNLLKKVCPNLSGDLLIGLIAQGQIIGVINHKKNVVVLWFVLLVLSIEYYFTENVLA